MSQDFSDAIKRVLFHYNLHFISYSTHGSLIKVHCKEGTFAVKKLNSHFKGNKLNAMRGAIKSLPIRIVSPLKSSTGDVIVKEKNSNYYVTPWITEIPFSNQQKVEYLIESLAFLHHSTLEMEPVEDAEKINRVIEDVKGRWRSYGEWLTAFVTRAEHAVYPSPFEQLIMAHYTPIMYQTEEAIKALEAWKESGKETSMHRMVVCHGQPSVDHFICDNRGPLFLNLETLSRDTPCLDLAAFYNNLSSSEFDWEKLLNLYEMTFQLRGNEKDLLIAYLKFPAHVYQLISNYDQSKGPGTEIKYVRAFERIHHNQPQREAFIAGLEKRNDEENNGEEEEKGDENGGEDHSNPSL